MFLNFVFSAACKQKRGGRDKELNNMPQHSQATTKPTTGCSSEGRTGAAGHNGGRGNTSAVAGPFQRDSVTSFKYSFPGLWYQCGLFIFNGYEHLGTAHYFISRSEVWPPLSLPICPYLEQEQQQEKIKGRTDSASKTVFIRQQQKRARDDQMFRSISSCETFEKTHSKSSKWVNLWASRPAPPQTWSLVPVYCWTHWSVYSPFIIHEKSQWSSQYIRRNNSDHLSTALLFLFPSPRGFHLLRFFLN